MTALRPFGEHQNIHLLYKALFFISLSVLLLLFESHLEQIKIVRRALHYVLTPVYLTLDFSVKQYQVLKEHIVFTSLQNEKLNLLQKQNLLLQHELTLARRVIEEDKRLQAVLASSPNADDYIPAQVIGEKLTTSNQEIVVDKGALHGVHIGMPVIMRNGLAGQVVSVEISSARVLLITDPRHATPVVIQRNRHRFILNGEGKVRHLTARDVGSHINAQAGDILVTSGLGERFPPGLPVGKVTDVAQKEDRSFLKISVQPMMRPYISSFVLIYADSRGTPQ